MSKDLDDAKREVTRLTELSQNAVIFKTDLDDEGLSLEKKPKSKKAKKQKRNLVTEEVIAEEDRVVAPPMQIVENEVPMQPNVVIEQSRDSSRSESSSHELHFEGG
jgi:hypothetical protein